MIYEYLSAYCTKKNISIKALEKKANLGNGTIQKWKTVSPTLDKLKKVSEATGISITTLVRESIKEEKEER